MKVTTIVFAHGDATETVYRHLDTWKKNTCNLIIVSPNNNPCLIYGENCLTYGAREHHGSSSLKRQLFAMKSALIYQSDYYVFLEYDALMLRPPRPRDMVQGNLFNEQIFKYKKITNDTNSCFLHFPWIFPHGLLKIFVESAKLYKSDDSPQDIWIIRQLQNLGMEVCNLLPPFNNINKFGLSEGLSFNSVDTNEKIIKMSEAVKNGAYALHGVKTKKVFEKILEARELFLKNIEES